jgi:hypothetical protein
VTEGTDPATLLGKRLTKEQKRALIEEARRLTLEVMSKLNELAEEGRVDDGGGGPSSATEPEG